MTTLTITPKVADKTARFKGTVAAGEHVAVTIKGGAEWLGEDDGANLTLRVLDMVTGRTLAVFPQPVEETDGTETDETETEQSGTGEESGSESESEEETIDPNAWRAADADAADLYCELNLNTTRMVAAARHMLRVPVLFVLGDTDAPRTLYFRDRYEVEFWPERVGDDTPYDLDKWPKQIDEWTELVAEFDTRLTTAETNISQAESRVDAAINAIPQTVATAVAQSNSGKADKVANATGGNLAALGTNGNLSDSGKKPSDFADATQFAAHKDNTTIHIAATERSTWNAKYAKPQGGIPKADLAAAVQTSLGKADSAIQEHQNLDAYVNAAGYDSTAREIQLKHGSTVVARIDATSFIKDGMVDSVEISGGNLVISFNTDAGVEDIEIPLTDIFNPANYYDKTAADNRFVQKEAGKGLFSGSYNDLTGKPAPVSVDPTLTQPGAAADAKATGDALRSGFTPWEFSGNVSPGVTYAVDITEYEGPVYIAALIGSDGTAETTAVDSLDVGSVSFTGSGITATRHRITPTKTSQLTNDGDGVSPFAKVSQLPDVSGLATKAELPYPFVPATVTQEGPQLPASAFPIAFSYTGDPPSEFSFGAEDVAISQDAMTGEWRVFSDSFGFVICVYTSAGAFSAAGTDITNLTFGGSSTPPSMEFPNVLTVTPRTVATYTAGTTAAAFTVAVGTGVTGAARDCVLVVDCTATGAVAPTVTWPSNFHPRTDAEEIAPVAGVRNVFYISEYATGEFVVGGWHEEAQA